MLGFHSLLHNLWRKLWGDLVKAFHFLKGLKRKDEEGEGKDKRQWF